MPAMNAPGRTDRMLVTFDYRNSRDLTELIEQEINQGETIWG